MMIGKVSFSPKYAYFEWLDNGLSSNSGDSLINGLDFLSPLV